MHGAKPERRATRQGAPTPARGGLGGFSWNRGVRKGQQNGDSVTIGNFLSGGLR